MLEYIIETIFGLGAGLILGITGHVPTGLILLGLEALGIGEFKKTLGAILFLNLFPITIGSVYEFWKAKQIDFPLSFILIITIILGSYLGSKLVVRKENSLSNKTIKLISAFITFILCIGFIYSAYHDKN